MRRFGVIGYLGSDMERTPQMADE
ncbi:MAG: hypothetical protein QOI74_3549, partial [Micromonosporaceae bacterium]|nr:hypothetical protein [Micromonosporaceae bacterium]